MIIVPKAGDCFGKQDPAYGLLRHTQSVKDFGTELTPKAFLNSQ